ncbi:hypothetical protein Tco_0338926, partial [Tanacetum coccineum]
EEDIKSDVMADIEADIATEAATTDEVRAEIEIGLERDDEAKDEAESCARGTVEIGVNRVIEPEIHADSLVPASNGGSKDTFVRLATMTGWTLGDSRLLL